MVRARRIAEGGKAGLRFRLVIVIERPADGGESQLLPRNIVPRRERDFLAFGSGRRRIEEARPVKDLHLADAGYGIDGEHRFDLEFGAGLFPRLAPRALLDALAELEEARRQRPESLAGFDGAPAHENLPASVRDHARNDAGINIVYESAGTADAPFAILARGNFIREGNRKSFVAHPRTMAFCCAQRKSATYISVMGG